MDELKPKQGLVATILPSRAARPEQVQAAVLVAQAAWAKLQEADIGKDKAVEAAAKAAANVGKAVRAAKRADMAVAAAWGVQWVAHTAWTEAQAAAWAAKAAAE